MTPKEIVASCYRHLRKFCHWYLSGNTYGRKERATLPYQVSSHQTPLFRHLQGEQQELQQNKVVNVDLAIQHLNSLTLRPGERLSYWRAIGNPTSKKGYLPGMTLTQGQITEGIGGGLCQLSNLIFWLTIHTPLTVVERWRHSYDVFPDSNRTQPFGSGATCSYPNIDLEILNETDEIYQLHLCLTNTHLVGEWKSTKPLTTSFTITERNASITHEPWCGYMRHNTIVREERDLKSDRLLNETIVAENHAIMMYDPLLKEPIVEERTE